MVKLTLMDKHSSGCHVLALWRTAQGELYG